MRIFVTGATGALGRHLVPGLVAAGHEVTATTRTPGKVAQLREAGAEPVVVDGLDREAVIAAVRAAAPEVIVHQMTALADMRSRNADRVFAATDELRTRGTDNLLAGRHAEVARFHRRDPRRCRRRAYPHPRSDTRGRQRVHRGQRDPPPVWHR
jgi:nucleoside-diphosphate-sugar epimerase